MMMREDQMLSMCSAMTLIFSLVNTRLIQREYINLDDVDCLIMKKVKNGAAFCNTACKIPRFSFLSDCCQASLEFFLI